MAASANVLGCFWALCSTSDAERLTAANDLLELLCTSEEDLQYCVERLVRGLGSNRKGARQGFSVALTEVLASFPQQVTPGEVLSLVEKHLQPSGSAKAEEERGCLFGQVCALMCLLRSDRLTGKDGLRVLRQLVALAGRKAYLQQVCCVALGQALHQLSGKVSCTAVLRELSVALEGGWARCSPTRLYLVLALEEAYRGKSQEKLCAGLKKLQWSDKCVVHEANLPALGTVLRGVTDPLHVVWPAVVAAAHRSTAFSKFWTDIVCDDLCNCSPRHQCVALHLVQILLPDLAPHEVHVVLPPSLLHCFTSGLASANSALHPTAHQLAQSMCEHCAAKRASGLAVLLQLLGRHGVKHLRDSTDVCSLLQLVEQVGADDILDYLKALAAYLFGNESVSLSATEEESILEQVSVLLQPPAVHRHSEESLVASACFLLLLTGFGGVQRPSNNLLVQWMPRTLSSSFNVEDQLSQLARQRLTAALTNVLHSGRAHSAKPCVLRNLVLFAEALLSSGRHAHLALSAGWEGQQQEAWCTATLFVRHFSPGSSTSLEAALCLLHVCLALQLLLDPPSKAAAGMVGELAAMQKDLTTAGQGGGDTGTWCEAFTDMLLSLLCQPSSLCREVASQVFRMTMAHQTRQSLELLIGVVDPRRSEELAHFITATEEEVSDDDGEEESGDEADLGSQSEEESSEEDDLSHNKNPEVDPDLRASVKSALGPGAFEMDSGDSLSDLSDDTMLRQDSALSAVLYSHLHSKGAQQRRREEAQLLVNYQLRVLKLLEAFVKRQSSSPWLVDLIPPLVRLTYRDQTALTFRAADIVKHICKGKAPEEEGSSAAVAALKDVMRLSYKVSSPEASHVLTTAVMWLLKVVGQDAEGQESPAQAEALEVLKGVLWDFVTKKNCTISFGLFQALFERHTTWAWWLIDDTVAASTKAASSFRKVQCYQLMLQVLRGATPEGDQHSHLPGMVEAAAASVMEVAGEVGASSQLNKAQLRLVTEALLLLETCVSVSTAATRLVPPQVLVTVEELMQNACARREKLLQSTCSKLLDLLRESHTPHRSSAQGVTPKAKRKKHN